MIDLIIIPGNRESHNTIHQELAQEISDDNLNLQIDFLKFLHANKEFEIYYFLLNKVAVKTFDNINFVLEIYVGDHSVPTLIAQIIKLLFAWTGEKYNVIFTKKENHDIISLKTMLISKIQSGSAGN